MSHGAIFANTRLRYILLMYSLGEIEISSYAFVLSQNSCEFNNRDFSTLSREKIPHEKIPNFSITFQTVTFLCTNLNGHCLHTDS